MKAILLALLIGAASPAFCQPRRVPGISLDSLQKMLRERNVSRYQRMPNAWGRSTPYSLEQQYGRDSGTGKPLTLLPPQRPGVYNLPIDGIPCIVPDRDSVMPMPNAWAHPSVPYRPAQGMPNPMDGMAAPLQRRP